MNIDDVLVNIKKNLGKFEYALVLFRRKKRDVDIMKSWKTTNKTLLTNEEKAIVKKYYRKYKKDEGLAQQQYKRILGTFNPRYISEDMQSCYIDPYFNDWYLAEKIDNKCYYEIFFSNLVHPESFAYRINNMWFDANRKPINLNELFEILETKYCDGLFIKEAEISSGGHGVFYIDSKNYKVDMIKDIFNKIKHDIIIQEQIKQHEILNRLNKSSVNSIRTISLLTNEGVKIYSSCLRMGIDGSKVDNASSGGITCGIDDDGRLKDIAFDDLGKKFISYHPTSNCKFSDIVVPNYSKVLELIKESHPILPHFRLISWDFAIRQDGEPIFIECNLCHGGLELHQFNNGPLYGDDTEKILHEVFGKK